MKPAAKTQHICPLIDPPVATPHVGGSIVIAHKSTVLIDGTPAIVVGDTCICTSPMINMVSMGSGSVMIDGSPAARLGDQTAHGGTIVSGSSSVFIGD